MASEIPSNANSSLQQYTTALERAHDLVQKPPPIIEKRGSAPTTRRNMTDMAYEREDLLRRIRSQEVAHADLKRKREEIWNERESLKNTEPAPKGRRETLRTMIHEIKKLNQRLFGYRAKIRALSAQVDVVTRLMIEESHKTQYMATTVQETNRSHHPDVGPTISPLPNTRPISARDRPLNPAAPAFQCTPSAPIVPPVRQIEKSTVAPILAEPYNPNAIHPETGLPMYRHEAFQRDIEARLAPSRTRTNDRNAATVHAQLCEAAGRDDPVKRAVGMHKRGKSVPVALVGYPDSGGGGGRGRGRGRGLDGGGS
ncbi:hypothetical protein CAC42_6162 [Sphaceloma murrayae]|uniref:Uncharacterized protein n=1 Tax=Sphaceloma murrayae TaxID=2082308 RepID=A0A2K1QTH2_9PEZI|nr:hypothetical protein CAC42_6162 [Sphaceloma murrayae]